MIRPILSNLGEELLLACCDVLLIGFVSYLLCTTPLFALRWFLFNEDLFFLTMFVICYCIAVYYFAICCYDLVIGDVDRVQLEMREDRADADDNAARALVCVVLRMLAQMLIDCGYPVRPTVLKHWIPYPYPKWNAREIWFYTFWTFVITAGFHVRLFAHLYTIMVCGDGAPGRRTFLLIVLSLALAYSMVPHSQEVLKLIFMSHHQHQQKNFTSHQHRKRS